MAKRFEIRNSTAEFLIFAIEGKEDGIQVMYQNDTSGVRRKLWPSYLIVRQTTLVCT